MKKLFILCSICLIFSSCASIDTCYRTMNNDTTLQLLTETSGTQHWKEKQKEWSSQREITRDATLELKNYMLQKDYSYCFQKSKKKGDRWIEGEPVDGISWKNAFNSSTKKPNLFQRLFIK